MLQIINIPNTLTIIRIVIIPVFVTCMIYQRYNYAFYLFGIAALTDLLDGMLARMTNQKTVLGKFLDPLADKFLLVSSFIIFAVYGWIPKWFAITVISRDLIIVIGWIVLSITTNATRVEPVFLGKLAIALQLIVLAYVILRKNIVSLPPVHNNIFIVTALVTALSGFQYIYRGLKTPNEE